MRIGASGKRGRVADAESACVPSENIRGGCQAILIGCVLMQYSAKLLKKPDQCRAVYNCSHLFWQDQEKGTRDGERWVMPCKQKLGSHAGSLCNRPVIRTETCFNKQNSEVHPGSVERSVNSRAVPAHGTTVLISTVHVLKY
jgi:hypothetical protein